MVRRVFLNFLCLSWLEVERFVLVSAFFGYPLGFEVLEVLLEHCLWCMGVHLNGISQGAEGYLLLLGQD